MIRDNIQHTEYDDEEGHIIQEIFIKSFELLRMIIKDNQAIKKVLIRHLPLLIELMNIKEYGQTRLIIDLYTNDFYT